MCDWNGLLLVQALDCRLPLAKLLPEPLLAYFNWTPKKKIQWKFNNRNSYIFIKELCPMISAKWRPFCLGHNELIRAPYEAPAGRVPLPVPWFRNRNLARLIPVTGTGHKAATSDLFNSAQDYHSFSYENVSEHHLHVSFYTYTHFGTMNIAKIIPPNLSLINEILDVSAKQWHISESNPCSFILCFR